MNLELRATDKLKPCPFCDGTELTLNNTHTASYWIWCAGCDAEMHGRGFGEHLSSEHQTRRQHRASVKSTVTKWNTRSDP